METGLDIKTFNASIERFDSELWHFHVKVPNHIVGHYHDQDIKRLVCQINDHMTIHCAFMPAGHEVYFININKEIRKKLDVEVGTEVFCKVWEDRSEYGIPMPEEFREVLDTDPDGSKYFHALTPGKQRSLIYLVGKLKSQDKRIVKSIIILQHLTVNNGKLDYKLLNEAFKQGI